MLEKISFKASSSQNIWSAFQNNNKETDKFSVSNPVSNMQNDNFVRTNVENDKSNNYSAYIWGGVIAAALIGAGIWYYVSHGKNPVKAKTTPNPVPASKPIQPPPINNKTFSISFKNIMSSFVNTIAMKDKSKYLQELSKQKLRRADCFKLLKNEEGILSLEQFFAVQNAKIKNNLALPNIIEMPNLNPENTSNVGKVFYEQFESMFEKRTYITGDTKEFLSALQDYTAKKSDNYTFMHIENFNELLSDLNKPENKSLLETFKTLLSQNEKKKLSYLTGKIDEYESLPVKKLSLEFKEGTKASDFNLCTNHYDVMHTLKTANAMAEKILETQSSVFKVTKEDISNIITCKPAIVLFKTPTPEYVNEFLNNFIKHTGYFSSDFDCASKNVSVILSELEKILENNLKITGRTGKINFIHMKNLEKLLNNENVNSQEYKKLMELLKNANKKYKTVFVAHSEQTNGKITELAEKSGSIIKYDSPYDEKLFDKLKKEAMERLHKADFGSVNPKNIETDYLNDLIAEKAGASMDNSPILGGILLKSHNMADNDKVAKALINTFGDLINYKKISFDIKNPEKSYAELYDLAEKCGQEYAKTKQRTIIEIDNIDELMLRDIDDKLYKLQATFKNFVETCSKNQHVTILVKTIRNLEDLDPSCRGIQRFSQLYTGRKRG